MPPTGPQQFDLMLYENYLTRDPAEPLVGSDIGGAVTVTINWNPGGTDLMDKGVEFSSTLWSGAGNGPLTVYDDAMGGVLQPVGTVAWAARTRFSKGMEPDTPNNRYRWTITLIAELVRTVTSKTGNQPETEVTYTASDTAKGGWIPQPLGGPGA